MIRLLLLLLLAGTQLAYAQITGTVTDPDGVPVDFANVLLLNAADSSFLAGGISEDDGTFALDAAVDATNALLNVSALGYNDYYSAPFDATQPRDFGTITLGAGAIALNTVEITAETPTFVRQIDRLVVNVDNRITAAGSTALEVLERSPGVSVNRQSGAIQLLGKEGVNIMVNGRMNYLPAAALLAYLEGMPASNLVTIELITTPPAGFDAQGNAGFINLVLRKLPDEGWRGSYGVAANVGRGYGGNGNVNLSYRDGKWAFSGNYSVNAFTRDQFTQLTRITDFGTDRVDFVRDPTRQVHNARLGLDYAASDRTTVGVMLSGYRNDWDMDARNRTRRAVGGVVDTLVNFTLFEDNDWWHGQVNAHLIQKIGGRGVLSVDLDYLYFDNANPSIYDLDYLGPDEQTRFREEQLVSEKDTPFDIQVSKADYVHTFAGGTTLSVGGKYVLNNFDNRVRFTRNGVLDRAFSSTSDLREAIGAGYASIDHALSERTALKLGLRYEHTDTDLNDQELGPLLDRNYGNFFPSIFVRHQLNDAQALNASVARRIDRPSFTDLAPFVVFLDPNTRFGGNPGLQPATSSNVEVGYRWRTIHLTLGYTRSDSTIANFQNRFDPTLGEQVLVPVNLDNSQIVSAALAVPFRLNDRWNGRFFANYLWTETTQTVAGLRIVEDQNSINFNASTTVQLTENLIGEVSGFYRTRQLNGNVRIAPTGQLNLGLGYKFPNGGRLRFNVTDVLNSFEIVTETNVPEQNFFVERTFDFSQRVFQVGFSANFGNKDVRTNERQSGSEERQRVN